MRLRPLAILLVLALVACTPAPDQAEVAALRQRQEAMEEQLSGLAGELENLRAVVDNLAFNHFGEPNKKVVHRRVRVSTYNATVEQCGPNPETTASGATSAPGWHAAVSRDLAKAIPMGSRVYVPGQGWWEVQDLMAESYQGRPIRNSMDLMLPLGAKHFAGQMVVEVVKR